MCKKIYNADNCSPYRNIFPIKFYTLLGTVSLSLSTHGNRMHSMRPYIELSPDNVVSYCRVFFAESDLISMVFLVEMPCSIYHDHFDYFPYTLPLIPPPSAFPSLQ